MPAALDPDSASWRSSGRASDGGPQNRQLSDPAEPADHRKNAGLVDPQGGHRARGARLRAEFQARTAEARELRQVVAGSDADLGPAGLRRTAFAVEAKAAAAIERAKELPSTPTTGPSARSFPKVRRNGRRRRYDAGAAILDVHAKYAVAKGWKFETISPPSRAWGKRSAVVNVSGEGDLGSRSAFTPSLRTGDRGAGCAISSTGHRGRAPEPGRSAGEDRLGKRRHGRRDYAQGPGGQNVNKVANSRQAFHRPTGIEVRMQGEQEPATEPSSAGCSAARFTNSTSRSVHE